MKTIINYLVLIACTAVISLTSGCAWRIEGACPSNPVVSQSSYTFYGFSHDGSKQIWVRTTYYGNESYQEFFIYANGCYNFIGRNPDSCDGAFNNNSAPTLNGAGYSAGGGYYYNGGATAGGGWGQNNQSVIGGFGGNPYNPGPVTGYYRR